MDFLFVVICIILIFVVAKRKLDNQVAELRYKYALYALRDKIRLAAINKEIDPEKTWLFQYYDQSFSKQIKYSSRLNIVTILYYWVRHIEEEDLSKFMDDLIDESEKNPIFKEVRKEFLDATLNYVIDQNKLLITYVVQPILKTILGFKNLEKRARRIAGSIMVVPETSVSRFFMHQH